MAALESVAGRRLSATRELDLTKFYFYQRYPSAAEARVLSSSGQQLNTTSNGQLQSARRQTAPTERKRRDSQDEEDISSSSTPINQSQQSNSLSDSLASPNSWCGRAPRRVLKEAPQRSAAAAAASAANYSADSSDCQVVIKSYSRLCDLDECEYAANTNSSKMLERPIASVRQLRSTKLAKSYECASLNNAQTKLISSSQLHNFCTAPNDNRHSAREAQNQLDGFAQQQSASNAHMIDLNANYAQTRKPSIEEQLRHLLELEPPMAPRRQLVADQLNQAKSVANKKAATGQSAISSQLQTQLKLVRKPHVYQQHQSATTARILEQQAMINPADRMMIFMLASKRAAALHESNLGAKNKLVLEWLENCVRAQRNTNNTNHNN